MRAKHVVLVHGLLGWGPGELTLPGGAFSYWDTAVDRRTDTAGLTVLEAGVGPVSSQHDRACELYARLRGRRTDYGAAHASAHGHSRWGADFTGRGLHPDWGSARPVHLVGHSAGGNTARQLQRLLADNFWAEDTGPDWVKSITCLASPLNGSPAAYMFGCDQATGQFRWPRLLSAIARATPRAWRLQHWGLDDADLANVGKVRESRFVTGLDNLAYDLTVQGCAEANMPGGLDDWPCTYYMSYVARCTVSGPGAGTVAPSPQCRALLDAPCAYMCSADPDRRPRGPEWAASAAADRLALDDPDWLHNDGLAPVASQRYPLLGNRSVDGGFPEDGLALVPGRWYHEEVAEQFGRPAEQLLWDHADFTVIRRPLWQLFSAPDSGTRRVMLLCGRRCGGQRRRQRRADDATEDPDADEETGGEVTQRIQRLFYERLFRRLSCIK